RRRGEPPRRRRAAARTCRGARVRRQGPRRPAVRLRGPRLFRRLRAGRRRARLRASAPEARRHRRRAARRPRGPLERERQVMGGFWKAPRALARMLAERNLTLNAYALLHFVAESGADRPDGIVTSNGSLADSLELSRKTVIRTLRALRAHGFLEFDD